MKAFLEEYGLIVVVCIAFAVLIALVVWATNKGKESSESTITKFTDKADTTVDQGLSGEVHWDPAGSTASPEPGK